MSGEGSRPGSQSAQPASIFKMETSVGRGKPAARPPCPTLPTIRRILECAGLYTAPPGECEQQDRILPYRSGCDSEANTAEILFVLLYSVHYALNS